MGLEGRKTNKAYSETWPAGWGGWREKELEDSFGISVFVPRTPWKGTI